MPNVADTDLDIPELSPEWFRSAVQPNHARLVRDGKRAVFLDQALADRFGSDDELEKALRAFLEATDHVRKTG